jgi:hypothetical protein
MKRNHRHAYNALKKIGCPVWTWGDDQENFNVDAESNHPTVWADYWSKDKDGWLFGVNPLITEILDKYNLYAEWVNPGHLCVYNN